MAKQNSYRVKWLHLRLSQAEHRLLLGKKARTTSRNLSQYVRNIIFNKPIVATYRNLSQDDFTIQMVVLNRELNALGNNLNQITKRLHTLHNSEQRNWSEKLSSGTDALLLKIAEVKEVLQKVTELWLR